MAAEVTLSALTLEQALAALEVHKRRDRRFPVPADLISIVQGTPAERAELALGIVHQMVRDVGAYRVPAFPDPAISHAISSMGGWVTFCDMPANGVKDAQFRKAYQAHSRETKPVALRGIHGGTPQGILPAGQETKRLSEILEEGEPCKRRT